VAVVQRSTERGRISRTRPRNPRLCRRLAAAPEPPSSAQRIDDHRQRILAADSTRRGHPNAVFRPCGQALGNLTSGSALLPRVQVVSSALDQVLPRLRAGLRDAKA
jgi:hypothetical protein